ncbi:FAD binding domain-containing protein [Rutstroemia sp. NJR-2017a WRK4]|nr:FAD binding domain-containing protein [Rutstroemia sp. NJR-2017a WRK4]
MASQLLLTSVTTTFLIIISIFIMRHLRVSPKKLVQLDLPEPTKLSQTLASVLPNIVIFPQDVSTFRQVINSYWAKQACEAIPACVVQPRNDQELCTAIAILKREYDERAKESAEGHVEPLFAIRGGGHSPVSGAASIAGGILIDLSLFNEVIPSVDGLSVTIGGGAKWMDVSKVLDEKGLAVVGGRNSAVGVGGLTLGGGLSFFSPRYGLVCSNIISYQIVLASGILTTASKSENPDLWRALKGGSNNFGIVTRFTARSFPCTKIWSGFLYMPISQAAKSLAAFHDFLNRVDSDDHNITYDNHAAGPIISTNTTIILPVQQLGIQTIAINLVYTKPPENKWPVCWKTSSFASLWRLWSTCKVRTLTSATDEMNNLNPPGRRQVFATTTIKNDPATLTATHAVYRDAIVSLRAANVKGLVWTLVLQPLLPDWVRKGDANPLGLHDVNEPLVLVNFTVNWDKSPNDELVQATTRRAIEDIERVAMKNGAAHPYRYLNYCAQWQRPFEGYGEENWKFLRDVRAKYDEGGLFRWGCGGGFKV